MKQSLSCETEAGSSEGAAPHSGFSVYQSWKDDLEETELMRHLITSLQPSVPLSELTSERGQFQQEKEDNKDAAILQGL